MAGWLYDDAMYRFDKPEQSYWEATAGTPPLAATALAGETRCDVAIIGGGYTGLSAAYHLCRDHQLDARVLEAGHIGWGASGRNGGFCSVGGDKLGAELMATRYGLDATREYYRSQVAAIQLVRDLLVDESIDADVQGDREIAVACSPAGFANLRKHAEFQFRNLGLDTEVVGPEACRQRYFDTPIQHGAAITRPTFGLHPLRFVRGLAAAAAARGATLYSGSEVIRWTRDEGTHVLATRDGELQAKRVILATNGFAPEHLHADLRGRPLPMISSIVVTRPLDDAELAAQRWQTRSPSITAVNLLNYFRLLPDNRLMFGGRGSADGSERSADRNYRRLIRRLYELFPAWNAVKIDYRWHGLVCMTRRMTPAVGRMADDPSVFYAFGYHGNGVNTATWAGKQLADWLGTAATADARPPAWLPAVVTGEPGRFPMARFRLAYIQAALAWLRVMDSSG